MNIVNPESSYSVYPVTHSFLGTLSSSSGYNLEKDTIEIYVPDNLPTDCIVNYVNQNTKSASVYVSAALNEKNKYEVFFGGNYARIDIETPAEENRNLLILKDSYANCFIPFLIPYYRNIIVIDARYYYDDIERVIENNSITDALILYNVNTFLTDNYLADILVNDEKTSD